MKRSHVAGAVVAGLLVAVTVVAVVSLFGGNGGGDEPEPERASPPRETAAADTEAPMEVSLVARAQESVSEVAVYETVDATEPVERLANLTANGGPLVFLIDGQDASGERLPVHLPIPPNGSKGWIDADDVSVLSGFTNNPEVAEEFGDDGVIGIHGTNRPELIGQDVSSGCVRMTNENIDELVNTVQLPLGVPVEIRA